MASQANRWFLDDVFIIDSTVHGYNTLPGNPVEHRAAQGIPVTMHRRGATG